MRLVLCDREDESAIWAWRRLCSLGIAFELVTSDELLSASRWEHRIEDGLACTVIELRDRRRIDSRELEGVLSRLTNVRAECLPPVSATDRDYALQELWALWMSWLEGLPEPVVGRPSTRGLSGPWLAPTQWLLHAARSGLATPPCLNSDEFSSAFVAPQAVLGTHLMIVACGSVIGPPAPAEVVAGCQRLARELSADILGIWFNEGWVFGGATPMPDLRFGAEALLGVLARVLGANE